MMVGFAWYDGLNSYPDDAKGQADSASFDSGTVGESVRKNNLQRK